MYSIESSFKYCEEIAKKHYENFPVASRLIPEDKRKYVYSIYAFARGADDFADEDNIGSNDERLQLIDGWNEKLRKCYEDNGNQGDEPVFIALRQTIKDCKIPINPLENLLRAFRQDVVRKRYDTFNDVLLYCENSANPVGRLVLTVFGSEDENLFKYSDYICTALQLTNFWQDVAIDLKKDRVYIPIEDIRNFGYSVEALLEHKNNEEFKRLMRYQVERTEELFRKGKSLINLVSADNTLKRFTKELKLIWLGGMEILNKVRQFDYDVFNNRPTLSGLDKIKLFVKSSFI